MPSSLTTRMATARPSGKSTGRLSEHFACEITVVRSEVALTTRSKILGRSASHGPNHSITNITQPLVTTNEKKINLLFAIFKMAQAEKSPTRIAPAGFNSQHVAHVGLPAGPSRHRP